MAIENITNDAEAREEMLKNARQVTDFIDENIVKAETMQDVIKILNDARELSISLGGGEAVFIDQYGELMYFPQDADRNDVSSYLEFKKAQVKGESIGYEDGGGSLPSSVINKLDEFAEKSE